MPFNFKEAFEKEKVRSVNARRQTAEIKRRSFDDAFQSIHATIKGLYESGIPTELDSPIADWTEQFYEHGCVWLNEDLKRLADLWQIH